MNCSEFEVVLNEQIESRRSPLSEEAVAHRKSCPACESLWRDHCLLESAISAWRPVEVPASLSDRVLRSLAGPLTPLTDEMPTVLLESCSLEPAVLSRRQSRRTNWVIAATVACVAMTCWMATRRIDALREGGATVARTTPNANRSLTGGQPFIGTGTEVSGGGVSDSVVAVLADLKAGYQELANETTATARDFVAVMPQSVAWPRAVLPVREEIPEDHGTDAVPQSGAELSRSIGDQIGQAIGFLWDTVPSRGPSG